MYTQIKAVASKPATLHATILPIFKDQKLDKADAATAAALARPEFTAALGQTSVTDAAKPQAARTVLLGLGDAAK
ncbi:MAG: hypothetical protein ACYTGQ_19805, partial [Planctomycetota bacterium]